MVVVRRGRGAVESQRRRQWWSISLSASSQDRSFQIIALFLYLNVIDFHDNLLFGEIPQQLGLLVNLSIFDVSNNKDMFGYPLVPMRNRGLSVLTIVGIGLGSGFLNLVISFSDVCIWLRVTDRKIASADQEV